MPDRYYPLLLLLLLLMSQLLMLSLLLLLLLSLKLDLYFVDFQLNIELLQCVGQCLVYLVLQWVLASLHCWADGAAEVVGRRRQTINWSAFIYIFGLNKLFLSVCHFKGYVMFIISCQPNYHVNPQRINLQMQPLFSLMYL